MKFKSVITGVIVMKDGKAWLGADPQYQSPQEGWGDPTEAKVVSSELCSKPTDILWPNHPCTNEVRKGKVVKVSRTVVVEIVEDA
jgi:hypothetical protein